MSTIASTPALEALCTRYLAAWTDHGAVAIAPLLTDDVVWEDTSSDQPHRSVQGDQVAWRRRMRGTMTGPLDPPGFAPAGRAMEVEGVDLWTLRDGRISGYRAFYDTNDLARRLGIAPPAGSRAEQAMVALQRLQARGLRRRAR
jgi:ketosteroid isomerase-like protein